MSTRRAASLESVRVKVSDALGVDCTAREAVTASLAACLRTEAEAVLPFVTHGRRGDALLSHVDAIGISNGDFATLLADARSAEGAAALAALVRQPEFMAYSTRIEAALRATLEEDGPSEAFSVPTRRAAVYWAMHNDDPPARIALCLGAFVDADSGRIEELASQFEDEGPDALLLSNVAIALAERLSH